ncbi:hypothetical protein [Embleya scabrispora]|uniref:hypothetical protein n=1 Tax=Embleya scabrispora TaxID=159449 RepID=UPI00039FBDE6|nr:hypothetical protein [Embleya scabrispora]MYS87854.1 hypothetical protein [Streptomyces sp. SID5474]
MSNGWRIAVLVAAVVVVASTPVIWLLDGPDAGQLIGASVQAATGVAALAWAYLQGADARAARDSAVDTGDARATGGGEAHTGVRRRGGAGGGRASAERTGDATADGPGSSAGTGVDYT